MRSFKALWNKRDKLKQDILKFSYQTNCKPIYCECLESKSLGDRKYHLVLLNSIHWIHSSISIICKIRSHLLHKPVWSSVLTFDVRMTQVLILFFSNTFIKVIRPTLDENVVINNQIMYKFINQVDVCHYVIENCVFKNSLKRNDRLCDIICYFFYSCYFFYFLHLFVFISINNTLKGY